MVFTKKYIGLFLQPEDTTEPDSRLTPSECPRCSKSKVELAEELEELHEEFEMLTLKSHAVSLSCV